MKPVLITSSILILLLAALRPLLRGRIDPRLQYALWLVTALRLLMPLELAPSAYSALALLDSAERPAQVAQAIGQAHVPIPAQSYDSAYVQVIREYEENGVDTTRLSDRELEQVDAQARERSQGSTLAQLFEQYARPLWLGGAALAGLWFLLVNLRLRRKLRTAELVAEDPFVQLPVYVSDALPSPCLCGIFRPAIYVTRTACATCWLMSPPTTATGTTGGRWRGAYACACTGSTPWCGGRRPCPGRTASWPVTRGPSAAWGRRSASPMAAPWWT